MVHVMTRPNVGGIATQVFGYCDGLKQLGWDVMLVTGRVGREEADAFEVMGRPKCRIEVLPDLGREVASGDARAGRALWSLLREWQPSVVHTHAAKAGTIGRLAAAAAGVPVRIHSFHGHVFRGYFSPWVSRAVIGVEQGLGLITSRVLVPGASQATEIADTYHIVPRRRVRAVPYGVPLPDPATWPSRAEARAHFGLPAAARVIGAVGRMAPIKHQTLLVDAFAHLRATQQAQDVHLLFVGDGECRGALADQVRTRGLADVVTFCSWEPTLDRTYAAMDLLTISSKNEGMPVTALEAMAAGVPVVSTAVGGVVDLVKDHDTGWLVPADASAETLGAAMWTALTAPDAAAVVARARAYVSQAHSFEAACRGLSEVYLEALQ